MNRMLRKYVYTNSMHIKQETKSYEHNGVWIHTNNISQRILEIAMNKPDKPIIMDDQWDSGELGRDDKYVRRASAETEAALDETLAMQLISVRLQKKMIDDLKFIAKAHGIGYQPLMRDILDRFIVHEVKKIVRETQARLMQDDNEETSKSRKAA